MPFDIKRLNRFPTRAGVYIMKDARGKELYIGKAKNLRQRVKQYFVEGGDGRWMIPLLMEKVETIDWIVVRSDKEALLVENNLIKKHQPRYNALLKDDKSYIALKMTIRDSWPAVRLVRYKGKPKDDGIYFGPYTSAYAARTTLDLIERIFPLRECSDKELARRTRPCILYQMGRCLAPCVGLCTKEEYDHHVQKTVSFLRGQDREIIEELYQRMEKASEKLEFEKAGAILRTIQQIEKTVEVQRVDKPLGEDLDAWGIYRQGEEVVAAQLLFRAGKLVGARHNHFSNNLQENQELLRSFLLQQYEKEWDFPKQVLLPFPIEDQEILGELISQEKRTKIRFVVPHQGEKKELIRMAESNAEAAFHQEKDEQMIAEKALLDLQEQFHLNQYPETIACFDNAHLQGSEPVSAMVVFTEGKANKNRYRKYKAKAITGPDDYTAMYEVLHRSLRRGKEENTLPDLLLVDGGKGHLHIAEKVLQECNIISVSVAAIAKEEGRHDKGLSREQIFLPNRKDPLFLKPNSKTLFLLQRIRDEAHRFAIGFHRQRRKKKVLESALDQIPGIGPVKKKALLRYFGSVQKIKEAKEEELRKVEGIHEKDVKALQTFFQRSYT